MEVVLILVGFGCFMAGFGIASILHASKDNVEMERKIRENNKPPYHIRYGRNIKNDDIWEGLGV